jgi:hypothetical protein
MRKHRERLENGEGTVAVGKKRILPLQFHVMVLAFEKKRISRQSDAEQLTKDLDNDQKPCRGSLEEVKRKVRCLRTCHTYRSRLAYISAEFRLLKGLLPRQMDAIVYSNLVHMFLTSVDTRLGFGRRDALGHGPGCSALWDKVLTE